MMDIRRNQSGEAEGAIIWLLAIAAFIWFSTGTVSPNSTKRRSRNTAYASAPEKKLRKAIGEFCQRDKARCLQELAHRTVQIRTGEGHGTGFIYSAGDEKAIILTASHVIRVGNGHDSYIEPGLNVYDTSTIDSCINIFAHSAKKFIGA